MKCSKCSFISFDYNQACPKCGNDLSHERELMNFPSYKPKNLSLLGVLTGDGQMSGADTLIRQSEGSGASGEGPEELLISLDSLSDGGSEAIQFEPGPSFMGIETKLEAEEEGADAGLATSLADLADDGPELMLFDAETEAATTGMEIENEVVFEPETVLFEEAKGEKGGFWETEALEQRMAGMEMGASEKDGFGPVKVEEAPGEGKEKKEPELFELELEPLELDMEIEESDKKTS